MARVANPALALPFLVAQVVLTRILSVYVSAWVADLLGVNRVNCDCQFVLIRVEACVPTRVLFFYENFLDLSSFSACLLVLI